MVQLRFGPQPGAPQNPSAPIDPRQTPQQVQQSLGQQMFGRFAPVATAIADFVTPATPLGTASQAMTPVDPRLAAGGTALGLGLGALGILRGRPQKAAQSLKTVSDEATGAMQQVARGPGPVPMADMLVNPGIGLRSASQQSRLVNSRFAQGQLDVSPNASLRELAIEEDVMALNPFLQAQATDLGNIAARRAQDVGADRVQINNVGDPFEQRIVADSLMRKGWDPVMGSGGQVNAARTGGVDALGPGGTRGIRNLGFGTYEVEIFNTFKGQGIKGNFEVDPIGKQIDVAFGRAESPGSPTDFTRVSDDPARGLRVMRWINSNVLQEMELSGVTNIRATSDVSRATAYRNFLERSGFDAELTINPREPRNSLSAASVSAKIDPKKLKTVLTEMRGP